MAGVLVYEIIIFQVDNTQHHYPRLYREAREINKHKNSFNKKEESLKINKIWIPALHNSKCKKHQYFYTCPISDKLWQHHSQSIQEKQSHS